MKIRITLPNKSLSTEAMREFAEKYIKQIEDAMSGYESLNGISIVVKVRNNGQVKLELTVTSEKNSYRRELIGEDYYEVLPRAFNEIEDAIYKHRDIIKSKAKKRGRNRKEQLAENTENTVVGEKDFLQSKKVDYTLMSDDAAIAELEKVGYDFFLYGDEETGNPKVVYHRQDGGYGIIEG